MAGEPITVADVVPTYRKHSFEYAAQSLTILFDQIGPHSNGTIDAWVQVRWRGNAPPPSYLHGARHEITGPNFARTIQTICEKRLGAVRVDWGDLLESCRRDVMEHLREGEPPVRLMQVQPASVKWLIRPLVGASQGTSLVGAGGSHKSMLALAAGVMVASDRADILQLKVIDHGPVLYLDWEAGAQDQVERLDAICAAAHIPRPPDLWYKPQDLPLYRTAESVARFVEREGVKLVVADSMMLARSGDASAADDTVRYYSALRHIGGPSFTVDHKSREAIRDKRTGAYGSVVNDNSARIMYEVAPVVQQGPTRVQVVLTMTKRNNVPLGAPLAFEIDFTNDGDRLVKLAFRQIDAQTVTPLYLASEGETLGQTILAVLRGAGEQGMTTPEVAKATGKDVGLVRARLNDDLKQRGKVTSVTTGTGRASRWFAAGWDDQRELEDAPY